MSVSSGIQLVPVQRPLSAGETITVAAVHDEYSMWFKYGVASRHAGSCYQRNVTSISPEAAVSLDLARPHCTCGCHVVLNTDRVWMINDAAREASVACSHACADGRSALQASIARAVGGRSDATVFTSSDNGYLALLAAAHPVRAVAVEVCLTGASGRAARVHARVGALFPSHGRKRAAEEQARRSVARIPPRKCSHTAVSRC